MEIVGDASVVAYPHAAAGGGLILVCRDECHELAAVQTDAALRAQLADLIRVGRQSGITFHPDPTESPYSTVDRAAPDDPEHSRD